VQKYAAQPPTDPSVILSFFVDRSNRFISNRDCFSHLLSRFKSSSRHFEQWANIRKCLSLFVKVFLAAHSATAQASYMLGICIFALVLQIRLRPYDDDNPHNIFNPADALLSNNHLEQILITLQISQLALGILSAQVAFSDTVLTVLYLGLFVLGIFFSLIALSNRFAKGAEAALKSAEPMFIEVKRYLGLSLGNQVQAEKDDQLAAEKLLAAARTYEQSAVAKYLQNEASLEHIAQVTGSSASRKKALDDYREQLAAKKTALRRESNAWLARRQEFGAGPFATKTEAIGNLGVTTSTLKNKAAADQEYLAKKQAATKDAMFEKEKTAFEARRRKSKAGGTFATEVEAFRRSSITQNTVAGEQRKKAYDDQQVAKKEGAMFMLNEVKAWKDRQERDGGATRAIELGNFGRETRTSINRKQTREDEKRAAIDRALHEDDERKRVALLWGKRQSKRTGGKRGNPLLREEDGGGYASSTRTSSTKSSAASAESTKPSGITAKRQSQAAKTGATADPDAASVVAAMYGDAARKSRASIDFGADGRRASADVFTGRNTTTRFSADMV